MKVDSLENYTPINNHVLIKPDPDNDRLRLSNGHELFLFVGADPLRHKTTTGTVVKVPDQLHDYAINSAVSLEYKTDMELQVGDKVVFHYLTTDHNVRFGKIVECGDDKYFNVLYDRIFCAIRNDEVIMLNGFIIVEAVKEELPKTSLILPDTAVREESNNIGVVRYLGKPLRGYRDFPEEVDWDEINVGDKVVFRAVDRVFLQNPMHQLFDKGSIYYRMQRRDILGVLTDEVQEA